MPDSDSSASSGLSRRAWLQRTALQATAGAWAASSASQALGQVPRAEADSSFVVRNGRIRQSVMGWCFNPMKAETLAQHARDLGLVAIEGIPRESYEAARDIGLEISLVSSHGFARGPCNPAYRDETIAQLTEAIDVAAAVKSSRVITFTGMRFDGMDEERAANDCIAAWKKVLPLAEKRGITLCLEHLNTRDDTHPMKGHPGYFGDDVDFCVELINRVGSDHLKLLFDIYHVAIMNGDVIRRIRQYKDVIAHYHTAGNPGRCELDDTQEINYPAVMKAIRGDRLYWLRGPGVHSHLGRPRRRPAPRGPGLRCLAMPEPAPSVPPRKLDPVTRARVMMAFWGLLLTGLSLLALVVLLGRIVRRRARLRLPPSRYASLAPDAGPLPPRDPPEDLPPGIGARNDAV